MTELLQKYHRLLGETMDPDGFSIPQAWVVGKDGGMSVLALAVPPNQGYCAVLLEGRKVTATEVIFAFDRFAKPGQGTTLGDLMAGHHFAPGTGWRPFIIEYRHEPRTVMPIDWSNAFWNAALRRELKQAVFDLLGEKG